MTATSAPFGFEPCGYLGGGTPPRMLTAARGAISAAYSSNIFENQPVLWNNGVLNPCTSAVPIIGSFSNVQYVPTSGNIPIWNNWWTASTPFVAGSIVPEFTQDQQVLFKVQADGAVSSSAVGDQADISNFTAGSTATGKSAATLSATLKGSGTQGQFRIIGLWNAPDNAWFDDDPIAGAYPILVVQIAQFQYAYPQTAI